jgi:hypothetical protein
MVKDVFTGMTQQWFQNKVTAKLYSAGSDVRTASIRGAHASLSSAKIHGNN